MDFTELSFFVATGFFGDKRYSYAKLDFVAKTSICHLFDKMYINKKK